MIVDCYWWWLLIVVDCYCYWWWLLIVVDCCWLLIVVVDDTIRSLLFFAFSVKHRLTATAEACVPFWSFHTFVSSRAFSFWIAAKVLISIGLSGPDGMLNGTVDGPCTSGNYFLAALPKTNLYLLVIENWSRYRQSYFYNFNCHISNRVYDAGAFRIVNGTCAHIAPDTSLYSQKKCPALKNIHIKCSYNTANSVLAVSSVLVALLSFVYFVFTMWWLEVDLVVGGCGDEFKWIVKPQMTLFFVKVSKSVFPKLEQIRHLFRCSLKRQLRLKSPNSHFRKSPDSHFRKPPVSHFRKPPDSHFCSRTTAISDRRPTAMWFSLEARALNNIIITR